MSQVEIRPATRDDLRDFSEKFSKLDKLPTTQAWVGEINGEAVAIGGFAYVYGRVIGFIDITKAGRGYLEKNFFVKVAFFKLAKQTLDKAREQGIRFIYSEADMTYPKADELLQRLGFEKDPRTQYLYRWRR